MFSVSKNIAAIIPYLWVNQDKRNKLLTVATFFCVALTKVTQQKPAHVIIKPRIGEKV